MMNKTSPGKIPTEVIQQMRKAYWVDMTTISELSRQYDKPLSTVRSAVQYENYQWVKDTFKAAEVVRADS